MSAATLGTTNVNRSFAALEGLRSYLAIPEAERIQLLEALSQPETIAFYSTAQKIRQKQAGAFREYAGECVAVVGQKLVGHDKDYTQLLHEVAERLAIGPDRVTIEYIEGENDPWF